MNKLQNFTDFTEKFKNLKLNKLILFLTFTMFMFVVSSIFALAQNYQFTLVPRRAYDQIHIEIWARAINANAPKLGHATLVVQYNATLLEYSTQQNLLTTDTIATFEANSSNPIQIITSDFHNANGYSALGSGSYSNGFIGLEINLMELGELGLQPSLNGKGSFLGKLSLNIIGSPSETDLANIAWSSVYPGATRVFDVDGNDINSTIQFTSPNPNYRILGITLLSPNQDRMVIDRDANYRFIEGSYADGGYPIYFERSVNPALYPIVTNQVSEDVAFVLQYSLNNGTTWSEIGRVAETSKNVSQTTRSDLYQSGTIFAPTTGQNYFLTTQNGTQINTTNFRQPLRVIWRKDPQFNFRSEQAKIRITQLNETTAVPILNRNPSGISTTNDGNLLLGRLFFVQLNGTSNYLRSSEDYSNATQLTVSAWINLNSYQAAGSNPAIVASSGGLNSAPIAAGNLSSNEGAWMLYLRDGRIPAFRAREAQGQGDAANPLYLAVCEAYALDVVPVASAAFPLDDAHSNNWVHLAATVADATVSLYVNGDLARRITNTTVNNPRMMTTNHPIWIGVNPNGNGTIANNAFLNAGIKNVQIWRTALTQDQIRTYAAGVPQAENLANSADIKTNLELYFPLEGTLADLASNNAQQGRQDVIFYADGINNNNAPMINNNFNNNNFDNNNFDNNNFDNNNNFDSNVNNNATSNTLVSSFDMQISSFKPKNLLQAKQGNQFQADGDPATYRPDQTHIKITSPAYGSGILNTAGNNVEIRWLTYGMTDIGRAATRQNYRIEYSIDDGETWTIARDANGRNLTDNNIPQSDLGKATWQPYQNNTPASTSLRTINPYAKDARIRISGIGTDSSTILAAVSDSITIAPHFAIKTDVGSILQLPPRVGMNISGDRVYIEAWIKPYRFPADNESFTIVQKSEGAIIHYSLRLNGNGTLSFIVTDANGTVSTAQTNTNLAVVRPNSLQADSAWTHVGVLFIRLNNQNISEARFYIDGNLQGGSDLARQFTQVINPNRLNEYPLYIGSGNANAASFVGEIKEVRFWNEVPNNLSITGVEPTEFSVFVQKSQAEVIKDLREANRYNLHSYFSMEGGTFVVDGNTRVTAVSEMNNALLSNYGTPVKFVPVEPFIKLIEPSFDQSISNTDTGVRVRWVGLYYDGLDFSAGVRGSGTSSQPPSLEYSLLGGGGGGGTPPYQYVGSQYWAGNTQNSIKLHKTNNYYSELSATGKHIGLALDASRANPDVNKDGIYNDQGPLSPTLTNARLRLSAGYTINGERGSLKSEGPLFTINPPTNFIVRVMLEGYHQGSTAGRLTNQLGSTYEQGGLRIQFFKDNSGEIGEKNGSDGLSFQGYTNRDPANLNRNTNKFGNVEFVFTDVTDGSYWLLVDHINHLPVMSRYPAPFFFAGESSQNSWAIKSGWDFMSWNGVDDNVMPNPTTTNLWDNTRRYYTARGAAKNSPNAFPDLYAETALIFNGGTTAASNLAGMVGGDVNKDNVINAADRVKVRQDAGLQSYESDITGDRYVNALDRTITDKNFGKVSSLYRLTIPTASIAANRVQQAYPYILDPFNSISDDDELLSLYFNKMAELVNYNLGFGSKLNTTSKTINNTTSNNNLTTSNSINDITSSNNFTSNSISDITNNNNLTSNNNSTSNTINNTSINTSNNINDITSNNISDINSTSNFSKDKTGNTFQAVSYQVSAQTKYNDSGWVDLSIYIRNKGEEFAPANCTFPLLFDPEVLEFDQLLGADSVLFNSTFDYSKFTDSLVPENGYLRLNSAPNINNPNAYNNIRSIEIDYDAFANVGGINVPTRDTYLGTLRFKIKNGGAISFKWHESKAVLTTKGVNVTSNGEWTEIPPILLYNVKITKPNGGEIYGPQKKQSITWETNGTAEIFIEFSSNSGATWSKINTTSVNSSIKQYDDWTTPNINSRYCFIRIIDVETGLEMSRSDSAFSIVQPFGTIIKPNANDSLYMGGKTATIEWLAGGTDCIKFEFSADGGSNWTKINGTFDPAISKTNWIVPQVTTKSARIKMLNCDNDAQLDISGIFTILAGKITFTEPRLNQVFYWSSTSNKGSVKWTYEAVEEFDLYLSTNGGRAWDKIEENIDAARKTTSWIIPELDCDSAMFKALYRDDPMMEYGRSSRFRIRIRNINPGGNESVDDIENQHRDFYIENIFPNPIKDLASLLVSVSIPIDIDIKLVDVNGAIVQTIATSKNFDIGQHKIDFSISGLSSGRYFLILSAKKPAQAVMKEINIIR